MLLLHDSVRLFLSPSEATLEGVGARARARACVSVRVCVRLTAGGSLSPDHTTASHRVSGASGAARSAVRRALLPLRLWEKHAPVQRGVTASGGREEGGRRRRSGQEVGVVCHVCFLTFMG